jgi:hypothetical protein
MHAAAGYEAEWTEMNMDARRWLSLSAAALLTAGAYLGCSASKLKTSSGATGAGAGSGGASATQVGPGDVSAQNGSGGIGGGCAKFSASADQAPAAMLLVLDRTASMSQQGKWGAAQLAIATAIDKDVFDTMTLGMSVFPSSYVGAPDCLCPGLGPTCGGFLPLGVACGAPTLPTIALAPAGSDKSNAAQGVRKQIYQHLVASSPETADPSDASPIYEALKGAYSALKILEIEKRIVVLITDGGFSCTSLSQRPGYSDGACPDWEYPDTVNQLITTARTDPSKPIHTFVVGVPGSNSNGANQGPYATAPYSMLLALSTYAVSGSPATLPDGCDKDATFTQNGAAPAKPCHLDLSGGSFDANALAAAIAKIRGAAVGCVYPLPDPPPGEEIDPGAVNVLVEIDGTKQEVLKRANMSDTCEADGCWDYDDQNNVVILGKTCEAINAGTKVDVNIYFGCASKIK